jgi:hypothetical protein
VRESHTWCGLCVAMVTAEAGRGRVVSEIKENNFSLGGADPVSICNSCLVLTILLQRLCHEYNCDVTLFASALYTY